MTTSCSPRPASTFTSPFLTQSQFGLSREAAELGRPDIADDPFGPSADNGQGQGSSGGGGGCTEEILGASHQVLGNFTSTPAGSTPAGIGIAASVYVGATGLSSAQFNALVPDSTGILP